MKKPTLPTADELADRAADAQAEAEQMRAVTEAMVKQSRQRVEEGEATLKKADEIVSNADRIEDSTGDENPEEGA